MSRYDKYDSEVSGARAAIAADMTTVANLNKAFGCGFDVNGRLVFGGAGVTGIIGVIVLTRHVYAGDIVDYMDLGEILEFDPVTPGTNAPAATTYYSDASGVISTTNTGTKVGYTVEAGRLRVHMGL